MDLALVSLLQAVEVYHAAGHNDLQVFECRYPVGLERTGGRSRSDAVVKGIEWIDRRCGGHDGFVDR